MDMQHHLLAEKSGEVEIGAFFPERHIGGGVEMDQADATGRDDEEIFGKIDQRIAKAVKAGLEIALEGAGIAHGRAELGHRAAFGLGDIKVADGEPFPQG